MHFLRDVRAIIPKSFVYLHAKACENELRLSKEQALCIRLVPSLQQILNKTLMSTQTMNHAIADYFKTQPVVKAWIFGSFARGEETPLSDVDLLVQYDENARISLLKHAAMICELERLLDRPVDIVEDGTLRPRVKESVNQDRKLIYERER